jgi:hypothetical protein
MAHAYYIKDVAPLIRRFTYDNIKPAFLPIVPYIIALGLLQIYIAETSPQLSLLVFLPMAYFNAIFIANLHRAYINNNPAIRYNPFKPTRNDWAYIWIAFLLNILGIMLIALFLVPAAFLGKAAVGIALMAFLPVGIFLFTRLSLVLPNRAIGGSMGLRDSYIVSKGLVWKMILAPLWAGWKIFLLGLAWVIVATAIFTIAVKMNGMDMKNLPLSAQIIQYIILIPYNIGVVYIMFTMGVSTLSHYYLWAKENWNMAAR